MNWKLNLKKSHPNLFLQVVPKVAQFDIRALWQLYYAGWWLVDRSRLGQCCGHMTLCQPPVPWLCHVMSTGAGVQCWSRHVCWWLWVWRVLVAPPGAVSPCVTSLHCLCAAGWQLVLCMTTSHYCRQGCYSGTYRGKISANMSIS